MARETLVTRDDVAQYVRDTLPYEELLDWDIDEIADAVVARWPEILGYHPEILDAPVGTLGGQNWYIDRYVDGEDHIRSDEYWAIVRENQVVLDKRPERYMAE
jgi:hypothetical protein